MIKKVLSVILSAVMVMSMGLTALAAEPVTPNSSSYYTVDDVKELEPFVSVSNGRFQLDEQSAIKNGFSYDLIKIQQKTFEELNSEAETGKITINPDLSIDSNYETPALYAGHAYNCGGGINTSTEFFWWGYARYMCDCVANDFAANLNSAASVAAGAAVVAAFIHPVGSLIGIDSAYWWLVASRVDANNNGRGVYVEMTYALVFDITPQ